MIEYVDMSLEEMQSILVWLVGSPGRPYSSDTERCCLRMTMGRLLPGMCHHRVYSVRDDHWGALHESRHALLLERCRGILVPLSTADEISYGYIVSLVVGFCPISS